MLIHLTAQTVARYPLLADWDLASAAWRWLRAAFPTALAVVLMPDHPHLIADESDPGDSRARLGRVLGALVRQARARRGPEVPGWRPLPMPAPIPDRHHLRRQVRYLALNPCRARLVRDPLCWPWSTHRDVMGAVVDPWVEASRLAAALGARVAGFAVAHHAYVSADPSCNVTGTPPPTAARASAVAAYPLERVRAAAASATRSHLAAISARSVTRLLFVHLAARHGWHDGRLLAQACGVARNSVDRLLRRAAAQLLRAGDLCLGDDRLLVGVSADREPAFR